MGNEKGRAELQVTNFEFPFQQFRTEEVNRQTEKYHNPCTA